MLLVSKSVCLGVENETYDVTEKSDGIETRLRRQCQQSQMIPRRNVQNNVFGRNVEP